MLDKRDFYNEKNDALTVAIQGLSEHLLTYPDSRYRKVALERVEEAYLWGTQMIHAELQRLVDEEAKAALLEMVNSEEPMEAEAGHA